MKLNNKIIQKVQNTTDKPGLTTKNRENGAKLKPTGEGDAREWSFKNVSIL